MPVVVISGAVTADADALLEQGIHALLSIAPGPVTLDEAMARAGEWLRRATAEAMRLVRIGMKAAR